MFYLDFFTQNIGLTKYFKSQVKERGIGHIRDFVYLNIILNCQEVNFFNNHQIILGLMNKWK